MQMAESRWQMVKGAEAKAFMAFCLLPSAICARPKEQP
ncbi:hypothetical protein Dcar01_00523 [Deinococcus carri]|uniref:Uncharacterized protein n=1 Tax=Deinococcus carri TaxID=1211323 RepID=A0ABP9W4W5_9DEIO